MTRMVWATAIDRPLLAAAGGQASVLRGEVGCPVRAAGLRGLDERPAEPGVALARPCRSVASRRSRRCPGRCQPRRPGGRPWGSGACPVPISATRISAMRRPMPGMRVQPLECRLETGASCSSIDGAQLAPIACVQIVDVRQLRGNQEPLVRPEATRRKAALQLGVLLLELPEREVRPAPSRPSHQRPAPGACAA